MLLLLERDPDDLKPYPMCIAAEPIQRFCHR